jgi:hypothetical protein
MKNWTKAVQLIKTVNGVRMEKSPFESSRLLVTVTMTSTVLRQRLIEITRYSNYSRFETIPTLYAEPPAEWYGERATEQLALKPFMAKLVPLGHTQQWAMIKAIAVVLEMFKSEETTNLQQ